jgi:putative hydrolase of the HAD superfamily
MLAPLITDLDGVLRLWNPEIISAAESRYGLPPRTLQGAVLEDLGVLRAVTTGEVSDNQWRAGIAERLCDRFGPRAEEAVAAPRAPLV